MSSIRNAVKRVAHKERAQPGARKKFGLLEKHKDYIERARDYQKKQKIIKNLKEKVENRNPDEFYFKMNKSQVVDGSHKKIEDTSLTTEEAQILKTQDLSYILNKKVLDDRRAERLRSNLHMIGKAPTKKHKLFLDDESEVDAFDPAEHFETHPSLVDRSFNRVRLSTIEKQAAESSVAGSGTVSVPAVSLSLRKKVLRKTERAYAELEERKKRSQKLKKSIDQLSLQRHLMGKGSKKKIQITGADGEVKIVHKWKRVRQS